MVDHLGAVRRRPVQRRSVERFERMLDVCAEVLEEVGYDALTTRDVAARAGVPIGTLYQFFEGKQALCRALAERNLELLLARLEERYSREPVDNWPTAGRMVVSEYVAMKREVRGFSVVDFGDARGGRPYLLDADQEIENNELVAHRLARFGVETLGLPDYPALTWVMRIAVEVTDAVLRLAFRTQRTGDPVLIAEAESLLAGYLQLRLGAPGVEPAPAPIRSVP